MKQLTLALAVAVALVACNEKRDAAATAPSTPAPPAAATITLTPEQLGELGAQIKKNPDHAHDLLTQHGLTDESFEKAVRDVTENPEASRRYAQAYRKAGA